MNKFYACLLIGCFVFSPLIKAQEQYNQWVIDAINKMPTAGGYELTATSVKKMRDAFSWKLDGSDQLDLNAMKATPSYCTTATYMVFYKVLERYWATTGRRPSRALLERLKPNLERDGLRTWGRWNSNGPGTAKFFTDAALGENFDQIEKAKPGDFLKIFWNAEVGKNERGHSVIYMGKQLLNGVEMIRYWGSNTSTQGFGFKVIPKSDAERLLFSRLTQIQNFENVALTPEEDKFLASMLSVVSSWSEVRRVSEIK